MFKIGDIVRINNTDSLYKSSTRYEIISFNGAGNPIIIKGILSNHITATISSWLELDKTYERKLKIERIKKCT